MTSRELEQIGARLAETKVSITERLGHLWTRGIFQPQQRSWSDRWFNDFSVRNRFSVIETANCCGCASLYSSCTKAAFLAKLAESKRVQDNEKLCTGDICSCRGSGESINDTYNAWVITVLRAIWSDSMPGQSAATVQACYHFRRSNNKRYCSVCTALDFLDKKNTMKWFIAPKLVRLRFVVVFIGRLMA